MLWVEDTKDPFIHGTLPMAYSAAVERRAGMAFNSNAWTNLIMRIVRSCISLYNREQTWAGGLNPDVGGSFVEMQSFCQIVSGLH